MCSRSAAGKGWRFWASGRKSWSGEWRCRQIETGNWCGERFQTHITTEGAEKTGWRSSLAHETVFNIYPVMLLTTKIFTVAHLDDEEECWGRVKGTVVESDDGGAMRAEQISDLQEENELITTDECFGIQFICKACQCYTKYKTKKRKKVITQSLHKEGCQADQLFRVQFTKSLHSRSHVSVKINLYFL